MMKTSITTRVLTGFDDPSFGPLEWERLLAMGESDVVFLTWQWQSVWWQTFQRGKLLLIVAERDGETVALAPLFTEAGMVYFVGSGGSDYLNCLGDISEPEVLDALLAEARAWVSGFIGFVFYHVPETSDTGNLLNQAAARLGLTICDQGSQPAPALEIEADGRNGLAAANKKSLVRHEKFFSRDGSLRVQHLTDGNTILPHLDEFFAQHVERWAPTASPSLFNVEQQKRFYRSLTLAAADAGWLRFTRLDWQGRAIAFHFGFCRRRNFLWYKPSYAIELARRSPGEALLRQLLLRAVEEGVRTFDFGLGEEGFKGRFATQINTVRNWGLYEPGAIGNMT